MNAAAPGRAGASRALPRPDFYLPWPARANPARETARDRARIWEIGRAHV